MIGRIAVLAAGIACLSVIASGIYARRSSREATIQVGDFARWEPSPHTISESVARHDNSGLAGARAHFARLFQERFRNHHLGVGAKFENNSILKISCAAIIPHADMYRIARAAINEATSVFRGALAVHLYVTTGIGTWKIAELKPSGKLGIVDVMRVPPDDAEPVYADKVIKTQPSAIMLQSVIDPPYVSADRAELAPDSNVIGLSAGGISKAYDVTLMDVHHVINDRIGDHDVAVTWCPLCRSASVYDRKVAGRTLTLRASEFLWNNALVMYDRELKSHWSQFTGDALDGPLKGSRLRRRYGLSIDSWTHWKSLHPDTVVVEVDGHTSLATAEMSIYRLNPSKVGMFPIRKPDDRLPPKEVVLGVALGGRSKAYSARFLRSRRLIQDRIGESDVLIYPQQENVVASVYKIKCTGQYRLSGNTIQHDGHKWDPETGKSLDGGADLSPVPHLTPYWFAWSAFYPDTLLR